MGVNPGGCGDMSSKDEPSSKRHELSVHAASGARRSAASRRQALKTPSRQNSALVGSSKRPAQSASTNRKKRPKPSAPARAEPRPSSLKTARMETLPASPTTARSAEGLSAASPVPARVRSKEAPLRACDTTCPRACKACKDALGVETALKKMVDKKRRHAARILHRLVGDVRAVQSFVVVVTKMMSSGHFSCPTKGAGVVVPFLEDTLEYAAREEKTALVKSAVQRLLCLWNKACKA